MKYEYKIVLCYQDNCRVLSLFFKFKTFVSQTRIQLNNCIISICKTCFVKLYFVHQCGMGLYLYLCCTTTDTNCNNILPFNIFKKFSRFLFFLSLSSKNKKKGNSCLCEFYKLYYLYLVLSIKKVAFNTAPLKKKLNHALL